MNWLELLNAAMGTEFGPSPRIVMFATADRDCTPHVRAVVVRRIDDAGRIYVSSDARSGKNRHARENPIGEIAAWLPKQRTQFRVEGALDVLGPATPDQSERRKVWRELSDATRATFDWPDPGALREAGAPGGDADRFPAAKFTDAPIPDTFELIRLRPTMVERLLLTEHPHGRLRWVGPDWVEEPINP